MLIKRLVSFFLRSATIFASFSVARKLRHDDPESVRRFNATHREATNKLQQLISTPSRLFNTTLVALILATVIFRILDRFTTHRRDTNKTSKKKKSFKVKSLQFRFLIVFWLLRCADWLQGPYFYELYASKVCVSSIGALFVAGFVSAAMFGPLVGRASDQYGRKKGTLAFCILFALGAASTESSALVILFLGRILSGIATSLMFSAPEAWLVAESHHQSKGELDETNLGETFEMVSLDE